MRKILFVVMSLLMVLIIPIATGCGMPQASFQSSSSSGAAPLKVTFTNGTKVKADSAILFDWDFGDGGKMTGTKITDSISHEYTVAGNYTITLTEYNPEEPAKTSVITQNILVTHGTLSKIKIIPEIVELSIGETQLFAAEAFDDYGNPIPEASFSWEEGDAGAVAEDGTFTAGTEAGEFRKGIVGKAELGGFSDQNSPVIVIKPDPLDTAALETLTIAAGESKQLVAVAKDKYGNVIGDLDATWSMLDAKAGTITSDGLFTASRKAVVYAKAIKVVVKQGEITADATGQVEIIPGELAQIGIAPENIDLGKGMTQQFVAAGADKYGNKITDITWVWSADKSAGTITQDGMFTAGNRPGNYNDAVILMATKDGKSVAKQAAVNVEKDRILYYSNRADENEDIYKFYSMNIDGTDIQEFKISYQGALSHRIQCSRDGRRILYTDVVSTSDSQYSTTYITNTRGTWTQSLIPDQDAYEPAISPDGKKIAYQSWKTGKADIYVMDIDGGNVLNLTNDSAYDDYPEWSPDGKKLLFVSDKNFPNTGLTQIFSINADGTGRKQLSAGYYDETLPQWSPDGTEILFQTNRFSSSTWSLYTMNADGTNAKPVSTSSVYNSSIARWSPDGSKIVFNSEMNGDQFDIYIIDRDGKNLVRVTDDSARDLAPFWLYPKQGVHVDASSIILEEDFNEPQMTAQQISNAIKDAVVRIESETQTSTSYGTGFIIDSDGLILTNNHVISDVETVTKITVYLTNKTQYRGTVLARDMVHDLALVKIDARDLPTIEIGNLSSVAPGQQVVVLGYPLGNETVSVTSGLVSTVDFDDGRNTTWVQTDSAINPGNSGGPLLDMWGRVIGVVTAKVFGIGVEGIGYAISANTVHLYLVDLIAEIGEFFQD